MHAKIILLPGSQTGERLCSVAEEILTDISVSFGHTFSILRDKIGEASERLYGTALSENTIRQCGAADAIFLGDRSAEGESVLLTALAVPMRVRSFAVGGLEESRFTLVTAARRDKNSIKSMFMDALELADKEHTPLFYVEPEAEPLLSVYREMVKEASAEYESVPCEPISPSKAVEKLILSPTEVGILVAPAYAGEMFVTLATSLHGAPMLLFDACIGYQNTVYEPVIPASFKNGEEINPIGTISAVAQMLRYSLKLEQEADCVDSAVKNILEAGWRTPDMTNMGDGISAYKMQQLISEQINLAGELLQGGGKR